MLGQTYSKELREEQDETGDAQVASGTPTLVDSCQLQSVREELSSSRQEASPESTRSADLLGVLEELHSTGCLALIDKPGNRLTAVNRAFRRKYYDPIPSPKASPHSRQPFAAPQARSTSRE